MRRALPKAVAAALATLIVSAVVGAVSLLVASLVNRDDSGSSPTPPVADDTAASPEPAASEDAVEVMVVWGEGELADFQRVVDEYDRHVDLNSVGPDIGAELDKRLVERDPPDVAIIPQPALVREYAARDWLQPINREVVGRFPVQWNRFVTARARGGAEDVYGAWVKGTHKSLVWYQTAALDGEPAETCGI